MPDEKLNDSLLEIIGRLQGRNQSLTKGHATLSRRVQELEQELVLAKQQVLPSSKTPFTVAGGEVHIAESFIAKEHTAADMQLQADIEHLRQRTDEIEKTLTHSFGAWARDSNTMPAFEKTVNRGIDQALRRAVEPGGLLYDRLL